MQAQCINYNPNIQCYKLLVARLPKLLFCSVCKLVVGLTYRILFKMRTTMRIGNLSAFSLFFSPHSSHTKKKIQVHANIWKLLLLWRIRFLCLCFGCWSFFVLSTIRYNFAFITENMWPNHCSSITHTQNRMISLSHARNGTLFDIRCIQCSVLDSYLPKSTL